VSGIPFDAQSCPANPAGTGALASRQGRQPAAGRPAPARSLPFGPSACAEAALYSLGISVPSRCGTTARQTLFFQYLSPVRAGEAFWRAPPVGYSCAACALVPAQSLSP
jgi:hypothetical protein